jgi:hypothetical protein
VFKKNLIFKGADSCHRVAFCSNEPHIWLAGNIYHEGDLIPAESIQKYVQCVSRIQDEKIERLVKNMTAEIKELKLRCRVLESKIDD